MFHLRKQNTTYSKTVVVAVFVVLLFTTPIAGETNVPGITVELKSEIPLALKVILRSGADHKATVPRHQLPWGSPYGMVIVASIAGGRCLDRSLLIDDPVFEEVTLAPNMTLSGEIDLEKVFPELARISKKSDVQLFWAYEAPDVLHISHWSGGWILIPQQGK